MEKLDELFLKLEDVQASAEDQPHPPELARPCHAPLAAADKKPVFLREGGLLALWLPFGNPSSYPYGIIPNLDILGEAISPR